LGWVHTDAIDSVRSCCCNYFSLKSSHGIEKLFISFLRVSWAHTTKMTLYGKLKRLYTKKNKKAEESGTEGDTPLLSNVGCDDAGQDTSNGEDYDESASHTSDDFDQDLAHNIGLDNVHEVPEVSNATCELDSICIFAPSHTCLVHHTTRTGGRLPPNPAT